MSDIVERLRTFLGNGIGEDAADEIESLRQLVDLWKTTAENQKTALTDLRQRVKELERTNEILRDALSDSDKTETEFMHRAQEAEAELAALKQLHGEPVGVYIGLGSVEWTGGGYPKKLALNAPLYTGSAPFSTR